ncbi:MAG: hypothetical protein JJ850_08810 [Kordiimonadaceae bacterium]|nr:hypothetical protein [Kordiimonadaceae bacterium]MBO6569228.1 hypothetical protein [Kordiimonadaceae bacterium]MBO6964704.1 hypothetical protein [Kordiimonadaceae bacterium]
MLLFRLILIAMIINIIGYTALTGLVHGWDLMPVFFGDIGKVNWPGQFNTDFLSMLLLSAGWTMWRNNFSLLGIGLGVLALFGGIMFLAVYLLVLTYKTDGDMKRILLGPERAGA